MKSLNKKLNEEKILKFCLLINKGWGRGSNGEVVNNLFSIFFEVEQSAYLNIKVAKD